MEADVVLWATGAAAPPVLSRMGLPTDAGGFLLTTNTLQSTGSASVFAVGDTGSIDGVPTPKAGVYAVRQGPVLWSNLQRMMSTAPLRRYAPQRTFLRLVNTGDGRAIGEWRGLSFEGVWCRRLKDIIDRGFVGRYQCPQGNRDVVIGKVG
jgi:selenide,water dikinase